MSSTTNSEEPPVLFESDGCVRRYILNRPKKHNALDGAMINVLRLKIKEWEQSDLCGIVVGTGKGASFCAGGDVVSVIKMAENEETRAKAPDYFRNEFNLDYALANIKKPYICVLEGNTMGGGVGLSVHAPFRIATETTVFAMPETKIGYIPDVGASHFLPLLDGELGTYLGLTGETIRGRAVFELGLATHFVPSRRVPQLLALLGTMNSPTLSMINKAIEEHYGEPLAEEARNLLVGEVREALDTAFGHDTVEEIVSALEKFGKSDSVEVATWAKKSLEALHLRSPTSLKVALQAVRRGKSLTLGNALIMEMGMATAFLTGASPDFFTGVNKVLVEKVRNERPPWNPDSLSGVTDDIVKRFFDDSQYVRSAPALDISKQDETMEGKRDPMAFALPTEKEIRQLVRGEHLQSGAFALTLEELVEKFRNMKRNKHGVDEKVLEVAARKCEIIQDPENQRCLRWK
ncbi:3-hydroxyisobutyryl-CoA hydrolase [Fomitiporia mediterranea MF3/22]|uniref:3-hydroxyisobutyryl-CoA hydrolase n=1 Tax=Fomitiporia mediterranea (strain MF3/22) TaxID=694068 RepID=UPI0004407AE6|nr:3-hydroxyisobutyryl-CoA hydrolase [Fomitiporia mediterranea MF3/22]EJD02197.1 3-hydroxyisobutyryl-CoA hydrolase [Fomitiporia mediterranea MF3/22]